MRRPARNNPATPPSTDPKDLVEPSQGSTPSQATWTKQDVWREVQPLHAELDRLRTELKEAHGRNSRQESFVWEAAAEANGLRAQLAALRQSNNSLHAELVEATAAADAATDVSASLKHELFHEGEAERDASDAAARQERYAWEASSEAQQEAKQLQLARSRLDEMENAEVAANQALVAVHAELEADRARDLQSFRESEIVQGQEIHWMEQARQAADIAQREELAADAARAEAQSEAEEARLAEEACQDERFLVGLARRKAVEEAVAWRLAQAEAATFGTRANKAAAAENMWHERALRWHAAEGAAESASDMWREEAESLRHGATTLKATLAVCEAATRVAEETAEAAMGHAQTEHHKVESLSAELAVALQRCRQRTRRSLPRAASEDLTKPAALPLDVELSASDQQCMLSMTADEVVDRQRSSRSSSETPKRRSQALEDDRLQALGSLHSPLAFSRKALPPLPRMVTKTPTIPVPAGEPSKLSPHAMAGLAAYSRLRMSTCSLDPSIGPKEAAIHKA